MKIAFFSIIVGISTIASNASGATLSATLAGNFLSNVVALSPTKFEAANRKGSYRVGGTGRSGKGSRYVGGRR